MSDLIIEWLANGETGASSKTIAFTALGKTYGAMSFPHDPADFNRCLKLLDFAPEAARALPILAASHDKWKVLVEHWEELKAIFIEEVGIDWSKGRNKGASKTYARMDQLLYPELK